MGWVSPCILDYSHMGYLKRFAAYRWRGHAKCDEGIYGISTGLNKKDHEEG
jgi:hypothetical protein